MGKYAKCLGGLLLLAVLMAMALFPLSTSATPSSSHANITLATVPDRPVAGEETRVLVTLRDKNQQPIANATVQVRTEMIMAGMAGMQHGSSGPAISAKPSDKPGEYVVTLKLTDLGDWKITATSGDSGAELKVTAINKSAVPSPTAAPVSPSVAVKVASASVKASSMEAVHASFLELTGNITDLRARVDLWKKGDADSQKIAEEKLERIQVVLGSVTWPEVMAKAVMTTTNAVAPMAKALKSKDVTSAEPAAKALGDGSHDVIHAFYGDWLPEIAGTRFTPMAPHAIYLDLTANIADLRDRVTQWQKGDEGSLNIAKEKVERIDVLLPHLSPSGMLLKPAQALEKNLPTVSKALARKDAAAAQEALKPIADASHDLTHAFYNWVDAAGGGNDLACVPASYRDLTLNIADLRSRVSLWQNGDEASYNIAIEKLERTELVLAHPTWPGEMAPGIGKTAAAVQSMAKALKDKNLSAAEAAAKVLGDGSHDVTHDYFGIWLPNVRLGSDEGQIATAIGKAVAGGHAHDGAVAESAGPNYYFVGSTIGIVLLTIVMVPILRRRELSARRVGVE